MTSFKQQIETVESTLGLSDKELARLFTNDLVTEQVVAQWRQGRSDDRLPRTRDIYQMKVIYQLALSFDRSSLGRDWLDSTGANGETPFEQICAGKLLRVQAAIDASQTGSLTIEH